MYFLFELIAVFFFQIRFNFNFFFRWTLGGGGGYEMTSEDTKPYCIPHHTDINYLCVHFKFFSLVINDSEGDIFRL